MCYYLFKYQKALPVLFLAQKTVSSVVEQGVADAEVASISFVEPAEVAAVAVVGSAVEEKVCS